MSDHDKPHTMSMRQLINLAISRRNGGALLELARRADEAGADPFTYLRSWFLSEQSTQVELADGNPGVVIGKISNATFKVETEIVRDTWEYCFKAMDRIEIDTSDNPDPICMLAREMLAHDPRFVGKGMDNEANAEDYIFLAADNPRISQELPESGFGFWKAAAFAFKKFKSRIRRA